MTWATRLALAAVDIYRLTLSPVLGGHCRFAPTCSDYARQALVTHGAARGSWLVARRLLRCHPFHPGGFDPPPPAAERPA